MTTNPRKFAAIAFVLIGISAWTLAQEQKPQPKPDPADPNFDPDDTDDAAKARAIRKAKEEPLSGINWAQQRYGWVNEPWTGDAKPYQDMKAEIDRSIFKGQKAEAITSALQKYKAEARKQPNDALAQYAWAFAAYKTALIDSTLANPKLKGKEEGEAQRQVVFPTLAALRRVAFPRTYEFARLRFLLEVFEFPKSELSPVGRRVAERDPKDYKAIRAYLRVAAPKTPQERQQAIGFAQTLIRLHPQDPQYRAVLGSMYGRSYARTGNKQYKALAIAGYQDFLRMAPANDPFRPHARDMIEIYKEAQITPTSSR